MKYHNFLGLNSRKGTTALHYPNFLAYYSTAGSHHESLALNFTISGKTFPENELIAFCLLLEPNNVSYRLVDQVLDTVLALPTYLQPVIHRVYLLTLTAVFRADVEYSGNNILHRATRPMKVRLLCP